MAAEISGKQMYLNGFAYQKSRAVNGRVYWVCKKSYRKECTGRAVTSDPADGEPVEVFKESVHSHAPNVDENSAEQLAKSLKRKAEEHPEQPPAQLLCQELQGVEDKVLSQLPSQPALVRAMQRIRRKELPAAPRKLEDVGEIPERYQKTLVGEQFLLHDSGPPDCQRDDADDSPEDTDAEDEPTQPVRPRVLVFATRKNIELLCDSSVWFIDGTFKTAPNIFTQIFTIIGLRGRTGHPDEVVAVPLVYALLTGKTQAAYKEVLEVVRDAVARFNVTRCTPTKIMSDFEIAIINACREVFPAVPISGCYFHLGQIIYRRVQSAGLQEKYRDKEDRSIKRYTHMLLAFVPEADVASAFATLRRECPQELRPVYDDFKEDYISGRRSRVHRQGTAPRYPTSLWNQYETAINKSHRTNNISEGWHCRFAVVIGKQHPDLYTLLQEFQKEQG